MSMREKIARAICLNDYQGNSDNAKVGWEQTDGWPYLDYADAALDALMDPSKEMADFGLAASPMKVASRKAAYSCFIAMIQAARDGK